MGATSDRMHGLTPDQRTMAELVERLARAERVPAAVIAAMLVNAHAESRFNPKASGDNGKSIGLFQLHEKGAGAGMTVAVRQDPEVNTKRILEVYAGRYGDPLRAALRSGVPELTRLWSIHVERAQGRDGKEAEGARRAATVAAFFPGGLAVPKGTRVVRRPGRSTWRYWVAGAAALAVIWVGRRVFVQART